MGILDRILGRRDGPASDAEGADRKPRGSGEAPEGETSLSPEERRENIERAQKITEMAARAAEHIEYIASRQVQDVPALAQKFAQVEGLWSGAEDLYTRMKRPSGSDLTFDSAQSAIGRPRGFKEAIDRAKSAHWAYEKFPKTHRSEGELEVRADFDAVTCPVQEYQARDHVVGSTRLREVMGL